MFAKAKPLVHLSDRDFQVLTDQIQDAFREVLQFELRGNQLRAGKALLTRSIVELATGEGKTAAAVLAVTALARACDSVYVCTANDYLAKRDADWMRPIYEQMGLTCASVVRDSTDEDRRIAYQGPITYGTIREFGFDHMRDRLRQREIPLSSPLQRPPQSLVVDEADSVLIDEARMPLVISGRAADEMTFAHQACYRWCAKVAPDFGEGVHYIRVGSTGSTAFTRVGRERVYGFAMPEAMACLSPTQILHALERAIYVNHMFHRGQHYLVQDQRVAIVDEYSGRISEGRSWSAGLHQAIEAREGLPLTQETQPRAQMTVQDFVQRFPWLSGMTGTALESRREFRSVYDVDVQRVPESRPSKRRNLPTKTFRDQSEKRHAIVSESMTMLARGQAVLIGTRTVQQSIELRDQFLRQGFDPQVLNAEHPDREAEIVSLAGQPGRVTVATNMAGRGTDIQLHESVRSAGGLHVIATELHTASRIDRQLAGRCARCGDPGSFRQYLSLEDDILIQAYGTSKSEVLVRRHRSAPKAAILRRAQRVVERRHERDRRMMSARNSHFQSLYAALGMDPVLDRVAP